MPGKRRTSGDSAVIGSAPTPTTGSAPARLTGPGQEDHPRDHGARRARHVARGAGRAAAARAARPAARAPPCRRGPDPSSIPRGRAGMPVPTPAMATATISKPNGLIRPLTPAGMASRRLPATHRRRSRVPRCRRAARRHRASHNGTGRACGCAARALRSRRCVWRQSRVTGARLTRRPSTDARAASGRDQCSSRTRAKLRASHDPRGWCVVCASRLRMTGELAVGVAAARLMHNVGVAAAR